METKISIRPEKIRLLNLLNDVGKGEVQIPIFQRDFVWETRQILDLFDSIAKGYPIGNILLWNPDSVIYPIKKIGVYDIPPSKRQPLYVLDGSQRITALFATLRHPEKYAEFISDENKNIKNKFAFYYDLDKKEFLYVHQNKITKNHFIPIYKILDTYEFLDFVKDLENSILDKTELRRLIDNGREISTILVDYHLSYTEIKGGDINSAVEIFSRVNSTGTAISEDVMLSARTYNPDTNFSFGNDITAFTNLLSNYNFENIKKETILFCICNTKNKFYLDVKFEDLLAELEELSKNTFTQIQKAVEFLYYRIFMINIDFLPYPTQLIFIANFYRLNPNPTEKQLKALEKWFWITTYSNYFTIYSLSQQREGHRLFVDLVNDEHETGILEINKFRIAEFPKKLNFTGVRPKALQLFFLNNICKDVELQTQESLKEFFIFNKKDRTPSNMIFRLSSEFESDKNKREIKNFILSLEEEQLSKYFLTKELQILYAEIENETEKDTDKINEFLEKRGIIVQQQEQNFIDSFSYFEKI